MASRQLIHSGLTNIKLPFKLGQQELSKMQRKKMLKILAKYKPIIVYLETYKT